jgi:hypothetical protein
MKISRLLSRTAALAGLAAISAGAVHAQSVTPEFISATGGSGDVTYTYELFATADTIVQSGDIFTMYDFTGLLGGAQAPTFTPGQTGISYAVSVQNSGFNPPDTVALGGDDPTIPNVSLTYNGTTFTNPGGGPQLLGTLVVQSTNTDQGTFTAFASNTTKFTEGTPAGNQGYLDGPHPFVSTPEPGAWAMFVGIGISSGVFVRRRNRRK